jgi:hypothetical protein
MDDCCEHGGVQQDLNVQGISCTAKYQSFKEDPTSSTWFYLFILAIQILSSVIVLSLPSPDQDALIHRPCHLERSSSRN